VSEWDEAVVSPGLTVGIGLVGTLDGDTGVRLAGLGFAEALAGVPDPVTVGCTAGERELPTAGADDVGLDEKCDVCEL